MLQHLNAADDRVRVRELARERLKALDCSISELQAARGWLRQLEQECAAGSAGSCPILKAFDASAD